MVRKHKAASMLLSMLLCLSLIFPMGITAFAESEYIAYIGDNGYTTLEEAVTAATDGDTITLAGNDLSKQQLITISKDLAIELNGYKLAGTHFNITDGNVVIRDQTGDGEINSNREIGFQSVFNPYVYATIYVAGGNLTMEGVTITGGYSPTKPYLNKAVIIDGGNIIVNSGTLTGGMSNNSGGDAIYVHGGFLSINGGTFVGGTGGGCGLSMDSSVDPLNITIKKGTFKGGRTDAAIYNATTQEKVEELFIREDIGNYIEGDFQRSLVVFNYADPTVKYSVVAEAGEGGTVSGGGEVIEGGSVTLTASANEGYTFDGWYEGDIKVCDTAEFLVENVTESHTYTARFTEDVQEIGSMLFSTSENDTLLSRACNHFGVDVSAITNLTFADLSQTNPSYYKDLQQNGADYSAAGDKSIFAYISNGTSLYICWTKTSELIAGDSLAYAFAGGTNISYIKDLNLLNTSNVTNMSHMFDGFSANNKSLALGSSFDTSNVTDMSYMFRNFAQSSDKLTLDLGTAFSTGNVTNMSHMFDGCGEKSEQFSLNLGDSFNTSKVTDMSYMFANCAESKMWQTGEEQLTLTPEFTFSLGDKFDTSSVTDMSSMFYEFGKNNTKFTLNLGNKFNTANVTNMSHMFLYCGWFSEALTLDLGDYFDTSKVTDMSSMFEYCGMESTLFTLDLGEKFSTGNVTNMSHMFAYCGSQSEVVALDLGDYFDTSKVTDMSEMFRDVGSYNTNFVLDLGPHFNTGNVTNMRGMFQRCGAFSEKFVLNLGSQFDTSKVTDMSNMFNACGMKSTEFNTFDLSGFIVSASTSLENFAMHVPATEFIFGDGWADATLPIAGSNQGAFYISPALPATITGATDNLLEYDWLSDGRAIQISAEAGKGGMVSGGGILFRNESLVLTATPDEGYTFEGWYEKYNDAEKACGTAEFEVKVENVTANTIYIARFTKNMVYYTVTANADEGGTVSGGGEVLEGGSTTLTASANEGYTFEGWYEGEAKVCDTAEFVVENVTADKTYTAKFAEDQPEPVEPSDFDFTSLRTLRTQDITVNHETKTIDINADADTDYITVFVHQLDAIPGGTFWMANYNDHKVVYDSAGSYRIYFLSSPTVSVLANITIGEQTEQYTVNVHFDMSKAVFDFTSLRGENLAEIAVDHETKTIDIQATDDAETIILYVSQHDAIYGGTLRMASYLGNKVTYAANGVYTIYSNGKENVSVKTNITINGVTEQYLINITFPAAAPDFSFSTLVGSGIKSVAVDHEARTIVLDTADDAIAITLPIDQSSAIANGTLRMASYMGNKVVLDAETRIYTIYLRDASTINVKVNITSGGETREYLVTVNFPNIEWGFDTVKAEQVKNVTVDHERQVIDMEVEEGYDNILLYIDQTANAGLPGQIWMKSYNGNDVVYHSDDRTYTISKEDKNSITVAVKITILGETRYYDININFASSGE